MKNIFVEKRGAIGLITLNRPQALNALCQELMDEVAQALDTFGSDASVRAVVMTGSEKAFAAGADIKEMSAKTLMDVYKENFGATLQESFARFRKPVIAAVAGYCLGGGCE